MVLKSQMKIRNYHDGSEYRHWVYMLKDAVAEEIVIPFSSLVKHRSQCYAWQYQEVLPVGGE